MPSSLPTMRRHIRSILTKQVAFAKHPTSQLRVCHRPRAPVGRVGRRRLQRGLHDGLDFLGRKAVGAGTVLGVLRQTRRPRLFETFPPQQSSRTRRIQAMRNRMIGLSLGGKQANPRPQDEPPGCRLGPNPLLPRLFLFDGHGQRVGGGPHNVEPTRTDPYCKDGKLQSVVSQR